MPQQGNIAPGGLARPYVLIAESDPLVAGSLERVVRMSGFVPFTVEDGTGAVRIAAKYGEYIRSVIMASTLVRLDGVDPMSQIHLLLPQTEIILLVAHETPELATHVGDLPLVKLLPMPLRIDNLCALLQRP